MNGSAIRIIACIPVYPRRVYLRQSQHFFEILSALNPEL
jgi:hypothetical protein